jgi:hypothetical protein
MNDQNIDITIRARDEASKTFEKLNKQSRGLVNWLKKGQQAQIGFNGAALSGLFFGMQLQRTFGGALKSIFEGYKKIIPESSEFNKMTSQLSANWEFFKFQLADALATSPLFQKMIEYAIGLLKAFQALPEPVKRMIVIGMALAAVIGSWLFVINTVKLGFGGLVDSIGILNDKTGKFSWGALKNIGWMALAAAGIAGITAAMKAYSESSETGKTAVDSLSKGWLKLLNSVLTPIGEAFGSLGFELEDWNEIVVFTGALFTSIFGAIGNSIAMFVALWRTAWNIVEIIIKTAAKFFIDRALEIVKAINWIAEASDWAFGTNFSDKTTAAVKSLERLSGSLGNLSPQLSDINEAWSNFGDTVNTFNDAIVNPFKAVEDYKAQLALNTPSASKTTAPTTTINQIVIDGTTQSIVFTDEEIQAIKTLLGSSAVNLGTGTGL